MQAKVNSGLGLRNLYEMNKTCLSKFVWQLCRGCDELWCKVLLWKYTCIISSGGFLAAKSYDSSL